MRKFGSCALLIFSLGAALLASPALAAQPKANGTSTCNITIPSVAFLKDLTTNTNTGSFPTLTAAPNAAATALVGSTSDSWELRSNTANGGQANVWVTGLTGPATLQKDISLTVANLASGNVAMTPAAGYTGAGTNLTAMPTASPGNVLCSMSKKGKGHFQMTLTVSAPFTDGIGTVTGTINLVGFSL